MSFWIVQKVKQQQDQDQGPKYPSKGEPPAPSVPRVPEEKEQSAVEKGEAAED